MRGKEAGRIPSLQTYGQERTKGTRVKAQVKRKMWPQILMFEKKLLLGVSTRTFLKSLVLIGSVVSHFSTKMFLLVKLKLPWKVTNALVEGILSFRDHWLETHPKLFQHLLMRFLCPECYVLCSWRYKNLQHCFYKGKKGTFHSA